MGVPPGREQSHPNGYQTLISNRKLPRAVRLEIGKIVDKSFPALNFALNY